jgi:uracil-DNA glycosylase
MRLKYDYSETPRIYYQTMSPTLDSITTLEKLRYYVEHDLEHPLKKTALHTVFSNNGHSDIMLIGEAPGEEEDKAGQPFVGKSGQLLMQIFASIGLKREDLYITNLVPWRPAGNRTPTFDEMDFFLPVLKKHILLKKPKIIVLLGGVVTKALISKNIIISKVRGTIMNLDIDGTIVKVLPTFHPSYLLRSPQMKKLAWEDMCTLKKFLSQ